MGALLERDVAAAERLIPLLEELPHGRLDSLFLRSQVAVLQNELPIARDLLEIARREFPNSLQASLFLSQVLLRDSRTWPEAEQLLQEIIAIEPGHVEANHNLKVLRAKSRKA
jgi:hypothetical protein